MRECFATLNARFIAGTRFCPCFFVQKGERMDLKIYKIKPKYIKYLSSFAKHLFHNMQSNQKYERKYIGIVLRVNGLIILFRCLLLKKNIKV